MDGISSDTYEIVVVGAGWAGLGFCKTWLQLHPDATRHSLLLLDKALTIGGVWCKERLYDGLRSNNLAGTYEFSDFPLAGQKRFGSLRVGVDFLSGETIQQYLCAYADEFGVTERFRSGVEVVSATKLGGKQGWRLELRDVGTPSVSKTIVARQLVVACGMTSQAFTPHFAGDDLPGAPEIIRFKDLKVAAPKLLGSIVSSPAGDRPPSVVVLGASKSAWDAVMFFASRDIHVHWIIRPDGYGPAMMVPPYIKVMPSFLAPKLWLEKIVVRRAIGWFSPCLWGEEMGWFRRWLHGGSRLGQAVLRVVWSSLEAVLVDESGLKGRPDTELLLPKASPVWLGNSIAIANHDLSIHDLLNDGLVTIHCDNVAHLSPANGGSVHLAAADSAALEQVRAVIASTKWLPVVPIKWRPEGIEPSLGVSNLGSAATRRAYDTLWHERSQKADLQILRDFPFLANGPALRQHTKLLATREADGGDTLEDLRKFRLYHFMVPPMLAAADDRSLVFLSIMHGFNTATLSEVQGLWACVYLDDQLPSGPLRRGARLDATDAKAYEQRKEALLEATAYDSQWAEWRTPAGAGRWLPDIPVDCMPYLRFLLSELGLSTYRKGGSWFREAFSPYGPEDFRGIVEEWKSRAMTIEK